MSSAVNFLAMWQDSHTCQGWLLNDVKVVSHNNSILIQTKGASFLYFIKANEMEVKTSHWIILAEFNQKIIVKRSQENTATPTLKHRTDYPKSQFSVSHTFCSTLLLQAAWYYWDHKVPALRFSLLYHYPVPLYNVCECWNRACECHWKAVTWQPQ